jgi:hypothetical protein
LKVVGVLCVFARFAGAAALPVHAAFVRTKPAADLVTSMQRFCILQPT